MSTQTEEVHTVFDWDTKGVEKGAQKIERAYDRVGNAEKNSRKGGHGSDGNLTAGIRDLAEGRVTNALGRFAGAAKVAGVAGVAAGGIFTAFKVARAVFDDIKGRMEATQKSVGSSGRFLHRREQGRDLFHTGGRRGRTRREDGKGP